MNSRTTTKRLVFAIVALMACGLTLAYAKGLLIDSPARAEENDQKGVRSVKSTVTPNTSASSAPTQVSSSGATSTGQTYTGRAIKDKEAVELADSVIVGRVVDLGGRDPDALGQFYYGQIKVEVVQTIKGPASKAVTLSLTVQTIPVEGFEETPKTDDTYIFFLKKLDPKVTKGIKLIDYTEDNLTMISNLVRSTVHKK